MDLEFINKSKTGQPLPRYAKPGDAGMDIHADIESSLIIKPLERKIISTGIYVNLPEGFEIQVRSRSGLSANFGIIVLNSPGTIDSGYKDEIKIILINLSSEDYKINPGDRIAQLVVAPVTKVNPVEVNEINKENDRGGGFGHTGN